MTTLPTNRLASRSAVTRRIVAHEWQLLRRDKTLVLVGILLAAAIGYAFMNGGSWRSTRLADVETIAGNAADALAANRAAAEADERRSLPQNVVVLPPGPLSDFAIGQSDLYPYQARISAFPRADTIFQRYQLDSPTSLLAGRFDLAFVVVFLLPLVIIALTFNMLSGEREGGTLALAMAQAVDLRTLTAGKVLLRLAVVLGTTFVLCLAGFLLSGLGEGPRLGRFLLWSTVVAAYALFWFGLSVAVGARGKRSETNAAILVCLWLGLVLILPGLLNVVVRSIQPVPTRLEYLSAMREASNEAAKDGAKILAAFYHEHPELASEEQQGGFVPRYFAQQRKVEALLMPILEDLENQLAGQQKLVERLSFVSPAVLVQESMNSIAGSDLGRQQRYAREARQYLGDWQEFLEPFIFRGEQLAPADYDALPVFDFKEEPLSGMTLRIVPSLLGLLLPALVLGLWGWSRLPRYQLVGH